MSWESKKMKNRETVTYWRRPETLQLNATWESEQKKEMSRSLEKLVEGLQISKLYHVNVNFLVSVILCVYIYKYKFTNTTLYFTIRY